MPQILQILSPGGMQKMKANDFWQLFLETGSPEAYLMYSRQLRSEAQNVYDDPGHRPAGNGLQ